MNSTELNKGVEAARKRIAWWRGIQPQTREMLRGLLGRQFDLLEICVQKIDQQANQLADLRKIIADREALKVAEQEILGAIDAPDVPMLPVTEYQHIKDAPPDMQPETVASELKTPSNGFVRADPLVDRVKEISQLLNLGDLDLD